MECEVDGFRTRGRPEDLERWCKKNVKHMLWIIVDKAHKGWLMIWIGVSG